jgi:hypothetical protein
VPNLARLHQVMITLDSVEKPYGPYSRGGTVYTGSDE